MSFSDMLPFFIAFFIVFLQIGDLHQLKRQVPIQPPTEVFYEDAQVGGVRFAKG